MLFTKKTWKNKGELDATPLNSTSLNDFETRIYNAFNAIYPIGSIYISVNNTNPSALFGGTWEEFGKGKTLVGVNANETEFNVPLKTGGSKTVTLTTEKIPKHKHSVGSLSRWASGGYAIGASGPATVELVDGIETSETGEGQPHENLQPYITVFFWQRTA